MGRAEYERLITSGRYLTAHIPAGWLILMEMASLILPLAMMPRIGNWFILMTGRAILQLGLNLGFLNGRHGICPSLISTATDCQISFWRTEVIREKHQIIS